MTCSADSPAGDTATAPDLLHEEVPAEPAQISPLRDLLAGWAAGTGLLPERVQDLLLAVYEAMANVVVHAYPSRLGTFTLHARHVGDAVTVTIRDTGQWQPVPRSTLLGGRGLPLIHTLADQALVETSIAGTTVTMTWTCGSLPATPATESASG
ncbi:Anti-sigma regulatory factor (Ser/Thr protein kinase) [Amycolatopsis pretoriensis]|uniref:Anti-sigma regulatory factor (Ser/Thr protein kinase) n=1 Tax=Amycolatopsis pretoriensis TaxID=218821 RepID=A0A1H5RFK9_9PSEU|nr:ATP-binding protein [Amycolatopsis pretoriensis]SEF37163.1 Anti-sigma regulatory factor (Ser/Thr protein kinase) [Amycolatopsis pretoriensis]